MNTTTSTHLCPACWQPVEPCTPDSVPEVVWHGDCFTLSVNHTESPSLDGQQIAKRTNNSP